METKTCRKCRQLLFTESFYSQVQRGKNGQVWRYFDSYCRECRIQYQTDRRRVIKRQCVDYLGGKCQNPECGYKTDRIEVYDFHHTDPTKKDFAISKNAKSFDRLKVELDKCVLLCCRCHRLLHGEEV